MARISRNAPCPCGSGKKYKRCCLARTQAPPPREEATPSPGPPLLFDEPSDLFESDLDEMSNRAVDLIRAGRLDEAEKACRELTEQHPDQVDGLMRFGMLYKARGDKARAAEYFRKAAAFMQSRPGWFDDEYIRAMSDEADALESSVEPPGTSQS